MTTSENECREAFEKWADETGEYANGSAGDAWRGWQAAWNARSRDVEIKAIRDSFKNLASVILDIGSGNYYKSHGIDVRVEPWLSLAIYASDVHEAIDAAMSK
jgi:hypothetical protein